MRRAAGSKSSAARGINWCCHAVSSGSGSATKGSLSRIGGVRVVRLLKPQSVVRSGFTFATIVKSDVAVFEDE